MAWETRARGGRYYVRKRWQNGRCVSEYIGGGQYAALMARMDATSRGGLHAERAMRRREEEQDAALDAVSEMAALLTTATLLVAGYHTHNGTWRRRREQYEG